MSDNECAADDCHRTIGPDSDLLFFCSPLCQMAWNQAGKDLMPYRPKDAGKPEMHDLHEVSWRPMTRMESAFDWLDARKRVAS